MDKAFEIWTSAIDGGIPGRAVPAARWLEDHGFDGMSLPDSQNNSGDPFVAIALAGHATTTLRFATGVTNPITRHPALLASTAASVQAETENRFTLGIGRGDSAAAHLGLAPASVPSFTRYLERLRGYLHGEEIPFDLSTDLHGDQRSVESLGMAGGPAGSKLRWLKPPFTPVPIDVAASGPRVIATAAANADALSLAIGADVDRLRWAIGLARSERQAAGLDPDTLRIGVIVPVMVDDDRDAARRMVAGPVGSYARFTVMHGTVAVPTGERTRDTLTAVHQAYDMRAHFTAGSPQARQLTDEVIDEFAIAGPAGHCAERLLEIAALGITRFQVQLGRGMRADRAETEAHRVRFATDVLPRLR